MKMGSIVSLRRHDFKRDSPQPLAMLRPAGAGTFLSGKTRSCYRVPGVVPEGTPLTFD
jgi:hypothetical protein